MRRAVARAREPTGSSTGTLRRAIRGHPHRRRSSEDDRPDPSARSALHPLLRLATPCFGTVPHSTGRSCASEIEEQITNMAPTTIQDRFGSASSAEMSLGICPGRTRQKHVDNMLAGLGGDFPPAAVRRQRESPALAGLFQCPAHAKRMGPAAETRDYGVDCLILALPCSSRRPIS
jgi:hypothetical protein